MKGRTISIRYKLMRVIMLTCGTVLFFTCAAFFSYEYITYRDITKRELKTLGEIIASNSTASLAFDNKEDAEEILQSLKAQKHLVAACLYQKDGSVYATYPKTWPPSRFPKVEKTSHYTFKSNYLEGFEPVKEGDTEVGMLYLKSDMKAIYSRFFLYGLIAFLFVLLSFLFAWILSRRMQRSISTPILDLAQTARQVSDERDYSVRAVNQSNDEVGILTDAFNHMLTQIQNQSDEIKALNVNLEEKVSIRTRELQQANTTLLLQNEFIQTIIDSSVDLIAVFNQRLEFVILNRQADQIYKRKRETMIGRSITDVFPNMKDTIMTENLVKALKGEFIHQDIYKSLASDRYFENFFIPLKEANGQIERVLVIGHDITSIVITNQKLLMVNAELEKSNRDLEQFAYVASHDLQEPLRKIQTFSELSEKNAQHPDILKRYLQKINSSANRMSELIKAVLNYSRLSKPEGELTPVDLNLILQNIRTDLELIIEEKKALLKADALPVIKGQSLQLHQLFLNLITNALKFCIEEPRIEISCRKLDPEQKRNLVKLKAPSDYIEISFRDNGIGFEQQYASQIFAIFQRLHSSTNYAGTGIGLALCKKIVENHSGDIAVISEPGKGTCFYVYLPLS